MLRYEMRKALYQLNVQFWNLWHFNPSITDILLLSNNFLYWIQRPNCPNSQTCINFSTQSSQMRKIISNGCKTKTKILNKQKKKPREDENKFYSILVLIIRLWSQHVQLMLYSLCERNVSVFWTWLLWCNPVVLGFLVSRYPYCPNKLGLRSSDLWWSTQNPPYRTCQKIAIPYFKRC